MYSLDTWLIELGSTKIGFSYERRFSPSYKGKNSNVKEINSKGTHDQEVELETQGLQCFEIKLYSN